MTCRCDASFKKIGKDEFVGLTICPPQRMSSQGGGQLGDKQSLLSILSAASAWTKLEYLTVNSFFLDDEALDSIDKIKSLRSLVINEALNAEPFIAKRKFLRELNTFSLYRGSTTELLGAFRGSKNLQRLVLEETGVEPQSIEALAGCPNLRYFQYRERGLGNDMVHALCKIKSLTSIYFKNTPLNAGQLKIILKACPNVNSVLLSGTATKCARVVGFTDPRVKFAEDLPAHPKFTDD